MRHVEVSDKPLVKLMCHTYVCPENRREQVQRHKRKNSQWSNTLAFTHRNRWYVLFVVSSVHVEMTSDTSSHSADGQRPKSVHTLCWQDCGGTILSMIKWHHPRAEVLDTGQQDCVCVYSFTQWANDRKQRSCPPGQRGRVRKSVEHPDAALWRGRALSTLMWAFQGVMSRAG